MKKKDIRALIPEIATSMTGASYGSSTLSAGMTYLGQFISHEIVPNTIKLTTSRVVTRELNLDSVYGDNSLYTNLLGDKDNIFFRKNGRFVLNENNPHDLNRIEKGPLKGTAVIPEQRNDENMIIAQLHLLWQKLHNALMDKGIARSALDARKIVTLMIQVVIIEDYLHQVLDENVFHAYFRSSRKYLKFDFTSIPTFFSHAGFRFGHSMVREVYEVNNGRKLPLLSLFGSEMPIPGDKAISWDKFFRIDGSESAQKALEINTFISTHMKSIPGSGLHNITTHIIERNLLAGLEAGLPGGKEFVQSVMEQCNRCDIKKDLDLHLLEDISQASFSDVKGLSIDNLPLWLYILYEAQVEHSGFRLGVLGSMIAAEVLSASMSGAAISVYKNDTYEVDEVMEMLDELVPGFTSGFDVNFKQADMFMSNLIKFVENS